MQLFDKIDKPGGDGYISLMSIRHTRPRMVICITVDN